MNSGPDGALGPASPGWSLCALQGFVQELGIPTLGQMALVNPFSVTQGRALLLTLGGVGSNSPWCLQSCCRGRGGLAWASSLPLPPLGHRVLGPFWPPETWLGLHGQSPTVDWP